MTTITAPVRPVVADQAIGTLLLAFASDPIIRWLYPAAGGFVRHFPELVETLGAAGLANGTVEVTGTAAALWVPPGTPPEDEEAAALIQRSIDASRHEMMFSFLEQVSSHRPTGAHWYLPFIGVDPSRQGEGHGSALLAEGLARCDRDGLPAYLEASSPRNRALYERHGFAVAAEVRAGDSPPLWPMLRPAG